MHCENVLSNAVFECNYEYLILVGLSGPILEGKGMRTIFQKKGKKGQNIRQFEQKCTMYKAKFGNILKKGQPQACDYRTHQTARTCPDYIALCCRCEF